ncbi:putative lipid II flippase FtsW [Candidatus Gottesmanbacteria bacterium]|nr:putative lipid II flippase FtsW [Candidatus Gottesmanbacteria bacterium]
MKSKLIHWFQTRTTHRDQKKSIFLSPDRWLVGIVLILALFGVLMVYDSSVAIAIRDFGDQYYFAREQLKWLGIGILSMFVLSRVDYHTLHTLALPALLGVMGLLVAVFIPGFGVRALGAHRWLNFSIFVLQPAELVKLVLVIYLAAWFSAREKGRLGAFLLLIGILFGLVILEPDLGTGIIIVATAIVMYFLSGAPMGHFTLLVPVIVIGISLLAFSSPYRFQRLTTYLNPERDPLGASYQIRQVLLALGSGGLTGIGIGKSRQKYEYLPEANTDSIFAIIGEETGFVGVTLIVGAFAFFVWRAFRVATRAPDLFGRLLAAGTATWIGVQSLLNIGAMAAVIPLTGVPLPLISYGGSSFVIILAATGILLNISSQRQR